MKGLTEFVRGYIGDRKRIDLNILNKAVMNSGVIDWTDEECREKATKGESTSVINSMGFFSVGEGVFAHLTAMTAEELKSKRKQFYEMDQTCLKRISQIDGQLKFMLDGTIIIPEPVKINTTI